jgi:hypothetical protein
MLNVLLSLWFESCSFDDDLLDVSPSLRLPDWPWSWLWLGDLGPPLPEAAAWAAAWARSFREALPRFLRSLMYSQPSPNSTQ